jgi:PAS domain-containing protein
MVTKSLTSRHNLVNQSNVAHALQMTLAAIVAAALAIAAFTILMNWRLIALLALVAATSAAVAMTLHRLGFVAPGLLFGIVGVAYAVMHGAAAKDGIQSIGLAVIPMLIVIASLLLGRRGLVVFTASAILATAAMLAIRYYVLRIEEYSNNDLCDFLVFAVICATAAVVGQILSRGIERGIVEERRESDEALRHSELKYRRLHESITDAVVTVDLAGAIIEFNPAYQSMLDYTGEELRRLTYKELTPDRWQAFEAQIIAERP